MLIRIPARFRHAVCAAAAIALPILTATGPAHAADGPDCSAGTSMYVVAHQDDDLFFQNPDLLHDIKSGRCVQTVFLTAGDGGNGTDYWTRRELGPQAAYAQMAGVANKWTDSDAGVSDVRIHKKTLSENPRISQVSLRLPDGNFPRGMGYAVNSWQSLRKLWSGTDSSIKAVDGSATYTRQSLISTLTALMKLAGPNTINTQNYTDKFDAGDHSDHVSTAYFTREAQRSYTQPHLLRAYQDYQIDRRPQNLSGDDLKAKNDAFYAYAAFDRYVCQNATACARTGNDKWLARRYVMDSTEPDVARLATVTASSQNASTGQTAAKALDGITGGYPGDPTTEWATTDGKTGSWLQLNWPTAQTVDQITLYDRPNSADQITGATLTFSDNSTVTIPALPNDGSALTVPFTARSTTSLRLTVNSVSPTTKNVGLSEIRVRPSAAGSPQR